MNDEFIESIITPKPEQEKAMVYRTFYGMETVAQFEEQDISIDGGDNK